MNSEGHFQVSVSHISQSSPYEEVNKPQARHEGQEVTIPGSIPQKPPGAARPSFPGTGVRGLAGPKGKTTLKISSLEDKMTTSVKILVVDIF